MEKRILTVAENEDGKDLKVQIHFEKREENGEEYWFAEVGSGESIEDRMKKFAKGSAKPRDVHQLLNKKFSINYRLPEELDYLPKADRKHRDDYSVEKS